MEENNDEPDHYSILGLKSTANDIEIKQAFRRLALKFHPDKNKSEGAEDRFKLITTAYSLLKDPVTRRRYDLSRPIS